MASRHSKNCSVVGFLDLFGDAWTLLIVREAFYGTTRFSEFQRNTGAAKNLLSDRLSKLVENGILERVNVGATGARFAYHITPKGESLKPLLAAIIVWSNEHIYQKGEAPTLITSRKTGEPIQCFDMKIGRDEKLTASEFDVVAGPGASEAARKRLAAKT